MQYLQSFFNSLEQLPNTLSEAYKGAKNGLNTLILLLVAVAVSKVLFGVLEALHSIPLLPSAMELVGTGYTVWFSYKYLYSVSGRASFLAEVERVKTEIFGQPKIVEQTFPTPTVPDAKLDNRIGGLTMSHLNPANTAQLPETSNPLDSAEFTESVEELYAKVADC